MTRHITLSTQRGMITELEIIGATFGPGERYLLRYHKTDAAGRQLLHVPVTDASMSFSGFRYRNNEVSILLLRQGRSSADA